MARPPRLQGRGSNKEPIYGSKSSLKAAITQPSRRPRAACMEERRAATASVRCLGSDDHLGKNSGRSGSYRRGGEGGREEVCESTSCASLSAGQYTHYTATSRPFVPPLRLVFPPPAPLSPSPRPPQPLPPLPFSPSPCMPNSELCRWRASRICIALSYKIYTAAARGRITA